LTIGLLHGFLKLISTPGSGEAAVAHKFQNPLDPPGVSLSRHLLKISGKNAAYGAGGKVSCGKLRERSRKVEPRRRVKL
jgi:hypothetical protein